MTEQAPPTGWIRLTLQGNVISSNMIRPAVSLNGYRVDAGYGVSMHPVPPGPWHIDVCCQWLREYGQAAMDVEVADGQTVDVFYAPPWHQFARGRIGTTRQKRPGVGVWLVIVVLVILIVAGSIAVNL